MNTLNLQFKKVTPLCLIVVALGSFAFSPQTRAACGTPDSGCSGGSLAEGYLALSSLAGGFYDTGTGAYSLLSNTTGSFNTGVGAGTLFSNVDATEGTAVGAGALFSSNAVNNTAVGAFALFSNTTGLDNTALGDVALLDNITGSRHTAVGSHALLNCVAPPDFAGNTAVGTSALFTDTTGNFNTAIGDSALFSNTTGAVNTAMGLDAMSANTTGIQNTATGGNALFSNTTANNNTANGAFALFSNTTGANNTALGIQALNLNIAGGNNTAVGNAALINSTGNFNTALGNGAGLNVSTANDVICIGNNGDNVDGTAWIGNVFGVATVSGTTAPVLVSNTGQLGTVASSERFKKDISTMDRASETILALRPVTFHYKTDTKCTPQFGLIAEEVARVNPSLIIPDKEGKPYTVRYDAVNAMLLNEFLKEHKKVEVLESTVATLAATVKEQALQIQKVGAQLELTKAAPQTVLNNH